MIKKWFHFIEMLDHNIAGAITLCCFLAGFFIMMLGASLDTNTDSGPNVYNFFIAGGFFAWGLTGVIAAIRQEFYQHIIIRGFLGRVLGIIAALFCWSFALYAIVVFLMSR